MSDGAVIWANRNSEGPKVTQQLQGSEWVLSVAFSTNTLSKHDAISMNPRLFGEREMNPKWNLKAKSSCSDQEGENVEGFDCNGGLILIITS